MYRNWSLALVLGAGVAVSACGDDGNNVVIGAKCTKNSDCGADLVCDSKERVCTAGFDGINGVFANRLVMGNSASTKTGTSQNLSQGIVNGILAYFGYINSTNGMHGRTLELDQRDDGYDPARAKSNVEAMVKPTGGSRAVFALIGNMGSPTSLVTMPVAIQHKTIFYAALSGAPHLRDDRSGRYVFNFRASYLEQAKDLTKYYVQKRLPNTIHHRNVAVFAQGENAEGQDKCTYPAPGERDCEDDESLLTYDNMDAYGSAGFLGVVDELAKSQVKKHEVPFATHTRNKTDLTKAVQHMLVWLGRPKAAEEYTAEDGTMFDVGMILQAIDVPAAAFVKELTDEIENVKGTGPSSDYTLTAAQVEEIKKVNRVDFAATVIAQTFLDDLKNANAAKYCKNVIASQIVPHPDTSNQAVVIDFREHMEQFRKDETADVYALEGYIAAKIWVMALEEQGRQITTESMIDTLEGMGSIDVGLGVTLGFSPDDHQASHQTWAQIISGDCTWVDFDLGL